MAVVAEIKEKIAKWQKWQWLQKWQVAVVDVQESAQHVTPKVPPSRTMSMGAGGASSNSTPPGEKKCILDKVDKESIFGTYLKNVVFCLQNKL